MMNFNELKRALGNLEEIDLLSDETEFCTEAMSDWNSWLLEAEQNSTITASEFNLLVDTCYVVREKLMEQEEMLN